jgi:hypothetical protein
MTALLFVYGTLRDPDLLGGALGRVIEPDHRLPAAAPGFRAVPYPGRIYPALLRAPGAAAPGLLLINLSSFERDLLDAYEGDEYRRSPIPVMVGEELHEAFAYLPAVPVPADAPDWTLQHWQTAHKPRVLRAELAALEALRQKLIVRRPN